MLKLPAGFELPESPRTQTRSTLYHAVSCSHSIVVFTVKTFPKNYPDWSKLNLTKNLKLSLTVFILLFLEIDRWYQMEQRNIAEKSKTFGWGSWGQFLHCWLCWLHSDFTRLRSHPSLLVGGGLEYRRHTTAPVWKQAAKTLQNKTKQGHMVKVQSVKILVLIPFSY